MANGQLTTSWRRFFARLTTTVSTFQIANVTPYAASGTITTASASYSYGVSNGVLSVVGQASVTVNGTGAGALLIPLPTTLGRYLIQAVGSGSQFALGAITG